VDGDKVGGAGSGKTLGRLTCKEVILDYLADYLDASLGPEAVADLERHLATCRPCQAYLNTYRATRDLTRRTAPPAMPEEMKIHLRRFLLEQLAKE
jgi:anti-sigma factor RsiW